MNHLNHPQFLFLPIKRLFPDSEFFADLGSRDFQPKQLFQSLYVNFLSCPFSGLLGLTAGQTIAALCIRIWTMMEAEVDFILRLL